MKIIISPNAFKGSLSASDAAFMLARAAREVWPGATVISLPMADGGAGTMDALVESTLGEFVETDCTDATGDRIVAPYGMLGIDLERPRTGVVELAQCCGLKNIPLKKRSPLTTTTFGAGEQVRAAMDEMCVNVVVGLGDTGTHDCGAGMAQALGVKLLDKHGNEIGRGGAELLRLHHIDMSGNVFTKRAGSMIAACDVTNPLTGKNGTAKIFAPQKGATPDAVKILEDAGKHFASVVKKELGKDVAKMPFAGAAGGTAAGLVAFFNAELRGGADLVLAYTKFDEKALDADLIITGEGRIDAQTTAGKSVAAVCAHAKTLRVPVIAFAGMVDEDDHALRKKIGLDAMHCISPDTATEHDAMRNARQYLYDRAREVLPHVRLGAPAIT